MITLKKKAEQADLVVRVSSFEQEQYLEDGWHPCPKKVWRRSAPAMRKDGSGPSTRVRIDPVRARRERR